MIARCPECQTRYRIEREKIGAQGARIRCSKCTTIFRVAAPAQEARDDDTATPAVTAPRPPLASALVAEADPEMAKSIRSFLERWRVAAAVVEDGAEALLRVHRAKPDLIVLGGHLPSVAAPVLCEVLRRSSDLRGIPIARIAPIDEPPGAPEFEADQTLEPADVPDALARLLQARKIGEAPPVPVPVPAPAASAAARPEARPQPAPAVESKDPAVAAAERLARIIISDIILYNEEKFRRGISNGNVVECLRAELEEASGLYRQRVPEQLRTKRNFLAEELERRAAQG